MSTLRNLRIAAFVALMPVAALASSGASDSGSLKDQVRATLTEQGYQVRKIEAEDGLIEAYALKDGKRFEIYFDSQMNVVKSKTK